MVDIKARKAAAETVREFRDGRITNFEFEGRWPRYDKKDRALWAIETMLWRSYDDLHEHKLDGQHALTAEGGEIFDRCILFLETELEYEWPEDNFIGGWGSGRSMEIITLGLSNSVDVAHSHANERELMDLHVIGENPSWPFLTRSDFEFHRKRVSEANQ